MVFGPLKARECNFSYNGCPFEALYGLGWPKRYLIVLKKFSKFLSATRPSAIVHTFTWSIDVRQLGQVSYFPYFYMVNRSQAARPGLICGFIKSL